MQESTTLLSPYRFPIYGQLTRSIGFSTGDDKALKHGVAHVAGRHHHMVGMLTIFEFTAQDSRVYFPIPHIADYCGLFGKPAV